MPLDCLSQAWPWTLAPLWFLILMSCLHGGQARGRMTNRYLLLISFVVKRPLNRDCLAEIVLHEMQLEQDSQDSPAKEHISPGSLSLLRKYQSLLLPYKDLHHLPTPVLCVLNMAMVYGGCFLETTRR